MVKKVVLIVIMLVFFSAVVGLACDGPKCIPVPSNIIINKNSYTTDRSNEANASSESVSNSTSGASSDLSLNQTDIHREYVTPGGVPIPPLPGFYSDPTPDSSFRSMQEMFDLFGGGKEFKITEGALERMAAGGDVESHLQVVRGKDEVGRVYDGSRLSKKWLYVGLVPREGLIKTALVDGEAKDADTNSWQVFGQMGLNILADGNNFFIFTKENVHRKIEASGWGIGFYTAGGLNSSNGQESITPGGGMGYAQSETGSEDRPWIQGYAGCLEMAD